MTLANQPHGIALGHIVTSQAEPGPTPLPAPPGGERERRTTISADTCIVCPISFWLRLPAQIHQGPSITTRHSSMIKSVF
jgi:hypothetical protein